jgi:hypothetical protein
MRQGNNIMKNIFISARRWFNHKSGNTYHSVKVSILKKDSWETLGINNFEYGYDDHYLNTATKILKENNIVPKDLYQLTTRNSKDYKINLLLNVSDVIRKRDLIFIN